MAAVLLPTAAVGSVIRGGGGRAAELGRAARARPLLRVEARGAANSPALGLDGARARDARGPSRKIPRGHTRDLSRAHRSDDKIRRPDRA